MSTHSAGANRQTNSNRVMMVPVKSQLEIQGTAWDQNVAVLVLSYFLTGDALKEGKKIACYIQIQLFRANRNR